MFGHSYLSYMSITSASLDKTSLIVIMIVPSCLIALLIVRSFIAPLLSSPFQIYQDALYYTTQLVVIEVTDRQAVVNQLS